MKREDKKSITNQKQASEIGKALLNKVTKRRKSCARGFYKYTKRMLF